MIYSPAHLSFWKAYFIHMRPYLLFLSGVAGLAGMAITTGFELTKASSVFQFGAFFLAYGFGQALTDCFQVDTDKLSAPYRPLSQGIVLPKHVGIVSTFGLFLSAGTLVYFNTWNILFGLLSIFGLATYSFIKKKYWFGGPFHNAWIVALLPIMGFLAASGASIDSLNDFTLINLILLSFFAYTNFVLIGYLKDISADRQTGYRTFPVVFGWDASVWVADLFLILSIYFGSLISGNNLFSEIFFIAGSAIAVAGQLFAHLSRDKTEENASFPIVATVRGFILWHLAVILNFNESLFIFSVVFYLGFEVILYLRPMKSQI